MQNKNVSSTLAEIANRIREMREIAGLSVEEMARATDTTVDEYVSYEKGCEDFPFSFIHKCSIAFNIDISAILEGHSAKLSSYTVTRCDQGKTTVNEDGILIKSLAPLFKKKIAEPYWVRYEYSESEQNAPIHLSTHKGQEFDYILSGSLKVQVGDNTEILGPGDSIYYNSSTPHGMIAVNGKECVFCAIVLPGDEGEERAVKPVDTIVSARTSEHLIYEKFANTVEDEKGSLKQISFKDEDHFNFAFDVVDELAARKPDKLALLHLDNDMNERRVTFAELKRYSSQAANYFKSLGIKRGDRVMLVLKRHLQFWISILALHKLGAIAIPATNQLVEHDFVYRFDSAGVSAIVCTADGDTAAQVELAAKQCPSMKNLIIANGHRDGWRSFDDEFPLFSGRYTIPEGESRPEGNDTMVMFFTSGTTGYPKITAHSYKYPLGHLITAKYWHRVVPDGMHLTISDTGWGKSLWGKIYGQWLCETTVFVYDFDRFNANKILPLFAKYNITTFCAPPTMYRMLIKEDLSRFDLSSIKHATTAGEALNPEVFRQFEAATGLQIMEGFGQTEGTLMIGNLVGEPHKLGSMGRPTPLYDVDIVDSDGKPVNVGESGEIVIRTDKYIPCGLFKCYYKDEEKTREMWHDGMYHTGDVAWKDEDGFYWYVGRADDVIKSSGYRIGPFEIESVIMELPYVLECGVSAAPDEIRGQVVKASIVLVKGAEGTEELKKKIQDYVKKHTAPYKYPRIIEFKKELPKTISGKIQRSKL